MSEQFYPSRGKIAISRIGESEETTTNGIIYTPKDTEIFIRGKVLSIGLPEIQKNGKPILIEIEEGDVVCYDRRTVNGVSSYDIVPYDAIIGVVEE